MPLSDPSSHPAHDPGEESARLDGLSLLALGERADTGLESHIADCPDCQRELSALRRTVALGRRSGAYDDDPVAMPSESVWDGIVAELGMSEPRPVSPPSIPPTPALCDPPPAQPTPARAQLYRPGRRAFALAAAAAVIAGTGVAGGYLLGHGSTGSTPTVAAKADLAPYPGGPTGVRGSATVHDTDSGSRVSIRATNLPLRNGYYEVWLYDPQADKMVAIGTLPRSGQVELPVPPGLDVTSYHVVDVSAQDYNGNPAHQQSVLRGGLRW